MKKIILIIFLCLIPSIKIFSQVDPVNNDKTLLMKQPVGLEFWLCFMQNYKEEDIKNNLMLELFITGDNDANVIIEVPAIHYKRSMFVPAGTVKSDTIFSSAEIKSYERIESGAGIHIISDNPISVYGLNRRYQTTDTYLGLPVNVLGKEYRTMCYHVTEVFAPIFAMVATEDNTVVTITPSAETSGGFKAHEPFLVTLNKGDVYQVKSKIKRNNSESDLTGSLIKSNKNIAVFSGHQCSYVPIAPPTIIACNHLAEQMPPISSWGKHFYLGRLEKRSQYTYRVLANFDETRVFENSQLVKVLKAGQFFEKNTNENLQITSDKSILVAQYSQGFTNGDSIGDPMMLLISPTQQFLQKYRFATPVNGSWNHYVNVVVPTNAINSLLLDGKKVNQSKFLPLGLSRFSIAAISVPFGTHSLTANEPFGMYSYGFGFGKVDGFDAYGNMGGQSFLEYVEKPDTLAPIADLVVKNDKYGLIIRDDRINDKGLYQLKVDEAEGLKLKYAAIPPNLPQLPVEIENLNPNEDGFLRFKAIDFKGNIAQYTLCYSFDYKDSKFKYYINDGYDVRCNTTPTLQAGIYIGSNTNFHSADFGNSGNLDFIKGKFDNAIGSNISCGLVVSKPITPFIHGTVKFIYQSLNGTLIAPDPDPIVANGRLMEQKNHLLSLNNSQINLNLGIDYYIKNHFYSIVGLNFSMNTSKDIELIERRIRLDGLYNNSYYDTKLNIKELNSLNSIRYGVFAGFGANYNFFEDYFVFLESIYNYNFTNMINDGKWSIDQLTFNFGFKYQF